MNRRIKGHVIMNLSDEKVVINSALSGIAQIPPDVVRRLGEARVYDLLSAAAAEAILLRFASLPSPEETLQFVSQLHGRFPELTPVIRPLATEGVIRTAFGETGLIDGIQPMYLRGLLFVLPYAIATQLDFSSQERAAFVERVLHANDSAPVGAV